MAIAHSGASQYPPDAHSVGQTLTLTLTRIPTDAHSIGKRAGKQCRCARVCVAVANVYEIDAGDAAHVGEHIRNPGANSMCGARLDDFLHGAEDRAGMGACAIAEPNSVPITTVGRKTCMNVRRTQPCTHTHTHTHT